MKDLDMRIWDKVCKKILYWGKDLVLITSSGTVVLVNGRMLMTPDYELLLSTTRIDSEKKKIFEGDVIQSNDGSLFEVVWEGFMFIGKSVDGLGAFTLDVDGKCSIIGNVYESPNWRVTGCHNVV